MLSQAIQHYVDMRRTCGFKFEYQARFLRRFLSFAEARGDQHVRINTAIEWAGLADKVPQRAHRLGAIIRFARHARTDDPRNEVPPPIFGSETWPRQTRYILTQDEVARLLQEARRFSSHPMRVVTYSTLIGLLGTVIGMIKSFAALATAGSPDSVALSAAIYEALINTAFGIATGALAVISYNFFTSKIEKLTNSR